MGGSVCFISYSELISVFACEIYYTQNSAMSLMKSVEKATFSEDNECVPFQRRNEATGRLQQTTHSYVCSETSSGRSYYDRNNLQLVHFSKSYLKVGAGDLCER